MCIIEKTISNKTLFCNRLECPHVWVRYHKLKSMLNSNSAFLVSLHLFMSTKQKYVINKDSIDAIYFLFQLPWIELLISNSSNCKMCLGNVYVIFILFLIKNYYSGNIFDVKLYYVYKLKCCKKLCRTRKHYEWNEYCKCIKRLISCPVNM